MLIFLSLFRLGLNGRDLLTAARSSTDTARLLGHCWSSSVNQRNQSRLQSCYRSKLSLTKRCVCLNVMVLTLLQQSNCSSSAMGKAVLVLTSCAGNLLLPRMFSFRKVPFWALKNTLQSKKAHNTIKQEHLSRSKPLCCHSHAVILATLLRFDCCEHQLEERNL